MKNKAVKIGLSKLRQPTDTDTYSYDHTQTELYNSIFCIIINGTHQKNMFIPVINRSIIFLNVGIMFLLW